MEIQEFDQCRYMQDQILEINKHKYIESEKAGCDLGEKAVFDWIKKWASEFRRNANLTQKYIIIRHIDD